MILNLQDDFDTNLPNFFDGLLVSDSTLADGRRIVLFTSKESLKFLARSDCIAMDGTFKIPIREYTFTSSEVSTASRTINFGASHNLITGEKVTYDANGNIVFTDILNNSGYIIIIQFSRIFAITHNTAS